MGFWEWLGVKKAKPNYGEAQRVYRRMMDMSDIDKMRESRMQDWGDIQRRAYGDISRDVQGKWGGTGADILGVTSSMPGEWATEGETRWMQDVGNPMARNIEREWLGATMQQKQMAESARQQLEEQARAEARAKTGAGLGLLGSVAGGVGGFLLGGPMGAAAGAGLGGRFGGGSAQQYVQNRNMMNYWDPRYNPYLNQGYPMYYPGQGDSMGGQQGY
jgi:hypothetical protein